MEAWFGHINPPVGRRRLMRKSMTGVIRLIAGETPLIGKMRRIKIMVP